MTDRVALAERVRDNLLMDGNVAACTGNHLAVRFTTRTQQSEFPSDDEVALFNRARCRGEVALVRGYVESDRVVVPVYDPGDPSRTLDTWYEVAFARDVSSLEELIVELRFALDLTSHSHR
ncbi:MAG TPA: hypothetical protein VKP30_22360, partial [Polyangiaceae bacterium]|nr:hypothetical protein [Polyangiaceae bacterium]